MYYNVRDFGAIGDGKTNDLFAFQRALEAMRPNASSSIQDVRGGGVLLVPAGNYFLNSTLIITHEVQIVGISGNDGKGAYLKFTIDASGTPQPTDAFPGGVSRLMFPRGVTGIKIALGGGPSTEPGEVVLHHAGGTIIRNLVLISAGLGDEPHPSSPEQFGHGISVKARAIIENCFIYNFNGNGIHIVAPSEPPLKADANEFIDLKHPQLGNLYRDNTFEATEIENGITTTVLKQWQANPIDTHVSDTVCRCNGLNGIYIIGSNGGNMLFEKVHCLQNKSYGFFDSEVSSANIYIACHSQENDRGGYYCFSSIAITNKDGILEYAPKYGNSSIYISCYQEQKPNAPTRIYSPAIILGGILSTEALLDPTAKNSFNYTNPDPDLLPANSAEVRRLVNPTTIEFTRPTVINNGTGWPATTTIQNGVRSYGGDVFDPRAKTIAAELGGTREQVALTLYAFKGDTGPYRLHYEGRGAATHEKWWSWILADQTDYASPLSLKSQTNPEPSESNIWLEMGYYVGTISDGRVLVKSGNAKPTDGTWPTGSRILNSNPNLGDYAGWIKTKNDGWRPYGKIE